MSETVFLSLIFVVIIIILQHHTYCKFPVTPVAVLVVL